MISQLDRSTRLDLVSVKTPEAEMEEIWDMKDPQNTILARKVPIEVPFMFYKFSIRRPY
jgi:hypothetical protein